MKKNDYDIRPLLFIGLILLLFNLNAKSQDWTLIEGKVAVDIAVGKDGYAFIVDRAGDIHKYVNKSWQTVGTGGKAVRIGVDEKGYPWVLNASGNIDVLDASLNKWVRKPGMAKDVAIGANGQAWVIGMNPVQGGFDIYKWNTSLNNWQRVPGGAVRIAVDPSGNAWVINSSHSIFHFNGSSFVQFPGSLKDIGVGANGIVWGTGPDDKIYKWTGTAWALKTGGAGQVSVGPDGTAWVVNAGGQLWKYNQASGEIPISLNVGNLNIAAPGTTTTPSTSNTVDLGTVNLAPITTTLSGVSPVTATTSSSGSTTSGNFGSGTGITVNNPIRELTNQALASKLPFKKNQTMEVLICKALGIFPYTQVTEGYETMFEKLDPLGQAFGTLGIQAAEIYFSANPNITAGEAINLIKTQQVTRKELNGILAMMVMNEINRNSNTAPAVALKKWSNDLYRSIKIRTAEGLLKEYQKWKSDPCSYEGLSATACKGKYGISGMISAVRPPQDLITINGLGAAMDQYREEMASGVTLGLSAATITAAAIATSTGLGSTIAVTGGFTTSLLITQTGLAGAFGGSAPILGKAVLGGITYTANTVVSGAIGATSWAGVVAAPVAAAVLAIVIGTIEGFAVVEAARIEPLMKLKLGAAMTQQIVLENEINNQHGAELFFMAFTNATENGFKIPPHTIDGEVRFYSQGGFVSKFALSYTVDGQMKGFVTEDLPAGNEKSYVIPYNAKNIMASGQYLYGGWKTLFNTMLPAPTYIGFTSYGTTLSPAHKDEYPEISNIQGSSGTLTLTHGGGYRAWIKITYIQNGQTVTKLDNGYWQLGSRFELPVPQDASNIILQVWSETGWVGEPWKTVIDKTYARPPNECIKIYGTTLDPKWNNECN